MERTISRIAETNKIKIEVDEFREKHPNSQELLPNLIKSLGLLHRQDRMKQLKIKGKLDMFLAKEVEIFKFMKELYGVDIDKKFLINRTMEQEDISEEINKNLISPLKEKLVKGPVIKNAISKIKPEQNNNNNRLKEQKRKPNTNQNDQETNPGKSLVVKNVEDSDDENSDKNNEFDSDDDGKLSSENDISQGHEGFEMTSMFKAVHNEEDTESCSTEDDGISDENIRETDTKKTLGSKASNIKNISDTSNEICGVDLQKLKENKCFVVSNSVKIEDSDDESEDENCEKAEGDQMSFFVGRQCSEIVQSERNNLALDDDDTEVDSSKYFKKHIFRKQPEKSLNFKRGGINMNEVPNNRRQRRILEGKSEVDPDKYNRQKFKLKNSRNFKEREESFSKIGKEKSHRPNKRSYDPNEVPLGERQSGPPALKKSKLTPASAKPVAAAIHPSWAAKKANTGSIHSFQGKKTTFDD